MRPKVSIVIPIYNTGRYLQRCLETVVDQTLSDIEIILVDDESPDNAGKLCDDYAKRYENIKVIHKKNGGLGFARNSGIEVATGEYIGFLDSDDFVDIKMYENLYNKAKEKNVDTCLCGHIRYQNDEDMEIRKNIMANCLYRENEVVQKALLEVLGTMPECEDDVSIGMSTCMGIYSLDVIKDNNIRYCSEREFISEDLMFNIDYYKYAKGVYVDESTPYYYCYNGESLSRAYKKNRLERNVIMYEEQERRLQYHSNQRELNLRMQRTFLGFTRVHICQMCAYYGIKDALKELKKICDNDLVKKILSQYPYKRNPLKYKVFNAFMYRKRIFMLWFLVKVKG